ncbi:MAG: PEGA domain-containing protein [Myxococcales bacterium]|nr:PEGA domain-containing protein [Myxococcales bacterium]
MNVAYLLRRLSVILSLVIGVAVLVSTVEVASAQQQQVPRPKRKGRKYKVRIDSAPQQAAIYLDDEKYGIVGYTPWSGRIQSGDWKVIIKKDGYEDATRVVSVKRTRRTQETFMPLVKQERPAVLEVRADADKNAFNAQVWVDGQLQGSIPVTIKLGDGRHLVEIKKDGFENFSQWVELKEGERVNVNPMLRATKVKEVGTVLVNADVNDAEVYLDGNLQAGKTPTVLSAVIAGPHVIEIRKPPALPWRQTVQVEADKTIKVTAELKATLGGGGGNIRVLSNVEGAVVYLDGEERGPAPQDLKNVKAGDHVVEIRAAGFVTREERVTVAVGAATVLKLDLQADSTVAATGTVKVVSPVPEAEVHIDGERLGTVPQERELAPGEHFVGVSKPGYKRFEEKLNVEEGKVITVTAELKSVGGLRFLSNPGGARVMMDGEAIGATPFVNEEIPTGEHIITVQLSGYFDFETSVKVDGGKMKVVNAVLERIPTGPTAHETKREQRSLTSFGARTLPLGRSTIDFGSGYPYYLNAGITVGAGKIGGFGFDAGVDFRSYFSRTDFALKGRLTFHDQNPFSVGVFGVFGGGTDLLGNSERGSFFADLGVQASLTGLGAVTVTAKAYVNMWSDRHCPEYNNSAFPNESDPIDTCEEYAAGTLGSAAKERIDTALGGADKIFERDAGARAMGAIIVEVAIRQRWNLWLIADGGFFQTERAAFLGDLYGPMFTSDLRRYARFGSTYKF